MKIHFVKIPKNEVTIMDENTVILPEEPTAPEEPEKEKHTPGEYLFEALEELCTVAVLVILLFMFVGRMATVSGWSMYATLSHNDRIIMTNLFYTPERGDIVVVDKHTGVYANDLIIKRIIAEGGDTVFIDYDNWIVTVNGVPVTEPYVYRDHKPMDKQDMREGTFTVPEGSYFVMGDNRNGSTDSRSVLIGFVERSEIRGKAIFRIFPFEAIGALT